MFQKEGFQQIHENDKIFCEMGKMGTKKSTKLITNNVLETLIGIVQYADLVVN